MNEDFLVRLSLTDSKKHTLNNRQSHIYFYRIKSAHWCFQKQYIKMYIHPKTYIQIKEENTMEELPKFITDERTGLNIVAGEDEPERKPIGVWGQRHLN